MAEPTLTDLFDQSGGMPVDFHGRTVSAVSRLPVRDGTRLVVTRLTSSRSRDEAIVLALDEGLLEIDGLEVPSLALWSSTSPRQVEIAVRGERASTIDVWNAWRGPAFEASWLGNAGIVEQAVNGGVTLQCSDGIGPADFTDLVVGIELIDR